MMCFLGTTCSQEKGQKRLDFMCPLSFVFLTNLTEAKVLQSVTSSMWNETQLGNKLAPLTMTLGFDKNGKAS